MVGSCNHRDNPSVLPKTGIVIALDGTQDDLLFAESDNEDPFEGFGKASAGEIEANHQLLENIVMELETVNEWSEPDEDSDYDCPDSPGH